MVNLTLAENDVLTERNVVLEERNTRTDSDPSSLFSEQQQAAMYLNHPYGRPIIGWRHELEALSREAALKFYRAHYAPDNAILVVAGDVTPEQVKELAQTHFGQIKPSESITARIRPAEPPQLAERRVIMEDARVGQPYLMRSYLAPSRQSGAQAEAAALVVLAQLLGNGPNSELVRSLQFETPVAVSTRAYYDALGYDHSTFSIMVAPDEGVTLAEAEAAMDETIQTFLKNGVNTAEFETVKAKLKAQEIYALDSTMGVARRYGAALTSGLTVADEQAWPEALQAVTPEQVMEVARKVFDRKQSTTGWLRQEADQ